MRAFGSGTPILNSLAPHLSPTIRDIVRIPISTRHRTALSMRQKTWNAPRADHHFPREPEYLSWVSGAVRWYRPMRLTDQQGRLAVVVEIRELPTQQVGFHGV